MTTLAHALGWGLLVVGAPMVAAGNWLLRRPRPLKKYPEKEKQR